MIQVINVQQERFCEQRLCSNDRFICFPTSGPVCLKRGEDNPGLVRNLNSKFEGLKSK